MATYTTDWCYPTGKAIKGSGSIYNRHRPLNNSTSYAYYSSTASTSFYDDYTVPQIPSNATITGLKFYLEYYRYGASTGNLSVQAVANITVDDESSSNPSIKSYDAIGAETVVSNAINGGTSSAPNRSEIVISNSTTVNWLQSHLNAYGKRFGVKLSGQYVYFRRIGLAIVYTLPETYTISVAGSPTNTGTVSGGGDYLEGSTATLTATPSTNYRFVQK